MNGLALRSKPHARDTRGHPTQPKTCRCENTAKVPHARAPTVDHIIPMSKGGPHLYINVQCACFRCNTLKGDRAADDQLRLLG